MAITNDFIDFNEDLFKYFEGLNKNLDNAAKTFEGLTMDADFEYAQALQNVFNQMDAYKIEQEKADAAFAAELAAIFAQEEADAAFAAELQAKFDQEANDYAIALALQEEEDAAYAAELQAKFDQEANDRAIALALQEEENFAFALALQEQADFEYALYLSGLDA